MTNRFKSIRVVCLEAFLAVSTFRSFTAAAAELGCDQSTISRLVDELERWLAMVLFETRDPPRLGSQGEAFLPKAKEIIRLLKECRPPSAPPFH